MPRRYDTYPDYQRRDVTPTDTRETPTTSGDGEIADIDPNAAAVSVAQQHGGLNEGKWTFYVRTSASGKKFYVYVQRTADGGAVTVDAEKGVEYTPPAKTAAETKKTPSIRDDGTKSRTETAVDPETGKPVWTRDKSDPVSQGKMPIEVDEKQGRALFWVPPDNPNGQWTQAWSPWGLPKTIDSDTVIWAPGTDIPVAIQYRDGTRKDLSDKEAAAIQAAYRSAGRLPSQGKTGAAPPSGGPVDLSGAGSGSGSGSGATGRRPAQDMADALALEKARRALLPEQELIIQNHYDTVDWIQGQIAAGLMTPQEGDKYLEQSKRYMEAALQGTTPYQQNQLKENLKRQDQQRGFDMVQDRVQKQNSLAQGLLSALANSKVMTPRGGGSLNLDVLGIARNAMAQDYGPNYSTIAQQLLAGGNVPMGQQAGPQATPADIASLGVSNPYATMDYTDPMLTQSNSSNPFERLGLLAGGRNGIVPNS